MVYAGRSRWRTIRWLRVPSACVMVLGRVLFIVAAAMVPRPPPPPPPPPPAIEQVDPGGQLPDDA